MKGVIDSLLDDIAKMAGVGAHEINFCGRNPK